MQFGLFDSIAGEPAALPMEGSPDSDLDVRRSLVMRSAALWQSYHDASGMPHTVDGNHAAELRRVAADMLADPEYYRAQPITRPSTVIADLRWFRAKGVRA